MPLATGGLLLVITDASTEPIATVTAKSNPLILEKLRTPANRVSAITVTYIAAAESAIRATWGQPVPSQSLSTGFPLPLAQ